MATDSAKRRTEGGSRGDPLLADSDVNPPNLILTTMTLFANFSERFRDPVLYVGLVYYVTITSHSFVGLRCSEKDYCNPIR